MITRKSKRRMSKLAKKAAVLHNDAHSLARRLKNFAEEIALFESGLSKARLDKSDRDTFGE